MRLNCVTALKNSAEIAVDAKNKKVYPFTYNGKTVVPVRFIENLGAAVKYTSATKPVTVSLNGTTITLEFEKSNYTVQKGGQTQTKKFSSPPKMIEGKTCVPFRAIAEDLGFNVKYDNATNTIIVTGQKLTDKFVKECVIEGSKLKSTVVGVKSIKAKTTALTIRKGQAVNIPKTSIVFTPSNAAVKILLYASSNPSVATVTSQGRIAAKKSGTTVITVYSHNGKTTKITVTVP